MFFFKLLKSFLTLRNKLNWFVKPFKIVFRYGTVFKENICFYLNYILNLLYWIFYSFNFILSLNVLIIYLFWRFLCKSKIFSAKHLFISFLSQIFLSHWVRQCRDRGNCSERCNCKHGWLSIIPSIMLGLTPRNYCFFASWVKGFMLISLFWFIYHCRKLSFIFFLFFPFNC